MQKRGGKRNENGAETKVNELKAADIVAMPEFEKNLNNYLGMLLAIHNEQTEKAERMGKRLKRTLIDWLIEEKIDGKSLTKIFRKIVNKEATGYSARQRAFLVAIGMEAYRLTLVALIEKEKKEKDVLAEKETAKN